MTPAEVADVWLQGYASSATRRAYAQDLRLVAEELGHQDWSLLDRAVVVRVMAGIKTKRAPNTVRRIHASIKSLAGELAAYGLISGMAYQGIRRQKLQLPKVDPAGRYLDRQERGQLFSAIPAVARNEKEALLLGAVLALGLGAGLRYSEVVALKPTDYDQATGRVRVANGKGDKERFVFLAGPAKARMDKVIGKGVDFAQFHRELWDSLRYHADLNPLAFHDLRRTFASDAWDAGIDASTIAAMLGHSSIQTTMKYDRRTDDRKRRAAEVMMRAQKDEQPQRPKSSWDDEGVKK